MKKLLFIIYTVIPCFCFAQKQGSFWVFGDSALVDFSDTSNITTGTSSVRSRGSCASISDSSGSLLFYSSYDRDTWIAGGPPFKNGEIWNKQHQTMQNGDSIVMQAWYYEVIIIPDPGNQNQYYVFSIGVTFSPNPGLWYSIVDISANGGLGKVLLKNQPLQNFQIVDCLTAVKHGNGRDWWVIFRRWNNSPPAPNNEFHRYLVTPAGVSNYTVQNIGAIQSSGFGNIVFNSDGSRFAYTNYKGILEIYDFDRCTGVINNPQNIYQENSQWPWRKFWGLSFSPNDSLLYLTVIPEQSNDTSRLLQFNLYAPNIAASADTLVESDYVETFGQLNKAPDGKIYLATGYNQYYPFADTMYNVINMNLSVINKPDNIGSACDLQLYSFYLGGKRVYSGLPNNPDYHLGPKIGSGCDTLLAINEHSQKAVISNLFPNPNNGSFTVNYFLPNGQPGVLTVFNFEGQKVFETPLPRYTYMQKLELKNLPAGIYALRIQSGDKSVVKKFVRD